MVQVAVRGYQGHISPRKLPPLEVTSKAVEVPEIWTSNAKQGSLSFATAVGLEVIAIVLLFLLFTNKTIQKAIKEHVTLIAPELGQYKPKLPPKLEKAGGGGGGGMKQPEPLSKGTTQKFAPQAVHASHPGDHTETAAPCRPTITAEAPKIDMDQYGDPNAKNLPFSGGPGTGCRLSARDTVAVSAMAMATDLATAGAAVWGVASTALAAASPRPPS